MTSFETPLLLIIFNRPKKVKALIDALAKVQPQQIYIMADGPRSHIPSDKEKCQLARSVASQIPWKCEVHTNFLEENIGCDQAVPAGIDWFFENVESGIILEDDCIPHPSFFSFCTELLEYYRDDQHVMHISGNNFQDGVVYGDGSYYFSHYSHSWGWATWKRAWEHYHTAVVDFPAYDKDQRIDELSFSRPAKRFWLKHLRNTSFWDGRWMYTTWYSKGICIVPNKNLISNIGFDMNATHTTTMGPLANLKTADAGELVHPSIRIPNKEADNSIFKYMYYRSPVKRVADKVVTILKHNKNHCPPLK